jgi:Ca-activated chloride channel homolog
MRVEYKLAAAVVMVWGTLQVPGAAQVSIEPRAKVVFPEVRAKSNIRVDSSLVLVPVTVCDPLNRPVTGLDREHFRVFEDRVEQPVTHFAMDDEPLAIGLVFDASGSMGNKMRRARVAGAAVF